MDIVSEEDHPLVVILNGLHLEDEQYVCLSLNLWIAINNYLGGDSQRISKHWGCIQHPSKWSPWLNVQIICLIVSQIGSQFRNGICQRCAFHDNKMQSLTQKALHPTNPRTYPSTSHLSTNSEHLFSNQSSACMNYDCMRGKPMMLCMKCVNIFTFAPTSTIRRTNTCGVSGTIPMPIWWLTNVKRKSTELLKSIVHLMMWCCRFQTH